MKIVKLPSDGIAEDIFDLLPVTNGGGLIYKAHFVNLLLPEFENLRR